jgi:predicted nuclease with TOPRIM domain
MYGPNSHSAPHALQALQASTQRRLKSCEEVIEELVKEKEELVKENDELKEEIEAFKNGGVWLHFTRDNEKLTKSVCGLTALVLTQEHLLCARRYEARE